MSPLYGWFHNNIFSFESDAIPSRFYETEVQLIFYYKEDYNDNLHILN